MVNEDFRLFCFCYEIGEMPSHLFVQGQQRPEGDMP
mgnify:CR=1 FL=1